MKKCFLIKSLVVTIAFISLSVMNSSALEFVSANEVLQENSGLLTPVFPESEMADFRLRADGSTPGIDFSHHESGVSLVNDYGRLHKYFGYATLALAGVAAVTSSNKSLHYGSAYAATGTALLTCMTGYAEYAERFDLDEGLLAPDNLHVLLGVVGTVAITAAVATADSGDESSHAGTGIAGGSLMLVSVVVIRW